MAYIGRSKLNLEVCRCCEHYLQAPEEDAFHKVTSVNGYLPCLIGTLYHSHLYLIKNFYNPHYCEAQLQK